MTGRVTIPKEGLPLEQLWSVAFPFELQNLQAAKLAVAQAEAAPKIIGPGAPATDPRSRAKEQEATRVCLVKVGELICSGRYKVCAIPAGGFTSIEIEPDLLAHVRVKSLSQSIIHAKGRRFECVRIFEKITQIARHTEPQVVTASIKARRAPKRDEVAAILKTIGLSGGRGGKTLEEIVTLVDSRMKNPPKTFREREALRAAIKRLLPPLGADITDIRTCS
jgi:hypothetical protein